jgi:ubiquinone/menaquinone biosynthesis C-methylase UbiE
MGWYEQTIFSRILERVLGDRQIEAQRRHVLAGVTGDILEVGIGTGLNALALPDSVRALTAVTYDDALHPLAVQRAADRALAITHLTGAAEALPCADASFDSVIATFLFCSLPDTAGAARECARVLRDTGRMFFLEHVIAPGRGRRIAQRILDLPSRAVLCGCSLVRDTPATLQAAGFELETIDYIEVPALPLTHRYLARGIARKRAASRGSA